MKNRLLLSVLLAFVPAFAFATPRVTETPAAAAENVKRHPLRGVITAVYPERASIMVKHEEIPGVMRAMTMLFRVDEATLKSLQKGQTITAMMSRQADEWWLHDVKVVVPAPAK